MQKLKINSSICNFQNEILHFTLITYIWKIDWLYDDDKPSNPTGRNS